MSEKISIQYQDQKLLGHVYSIKNPKAWIIFAHGSGSSHLSKRNNWVAKDLSEHGFSTMLFDLLTPSEDENYSNRFDIKILADRLLLATKWLILSPYYHNEPIGYFGASTGAAAAIVAAAKADQSIPLYALVSRGGRPDLAGREFLNDVFIPTLLIVGNHDTEVIKLNEMALKEIPEAKLVLIPGATHLFEEPGTLNEVVQLANDWFEIHLQDIFKDMDQSHLE